MSNTSSSKVNGQYIHQRGEFTGPALSSPEPIPATVEIRQIQYEEGSPEKVDIKKLYEVYSPGRGPVLESTLALIADALGQVVDRIRKALGESDQLQCENHIAVALGLFLQTRTFLGTFTGFDDGFTLLLTAIIAHRSAAYTTKELRAVEKALELLRRNPNLSIEDIDVLSSSLENAGFDLNAPMAGIELDEEPDSLIE